MLARLVVLCGLFLVVGLSPAFAQQEARSSTKGASTPLPITGTSVDADHNALDVYIRGGASGSGGGTEFNEDTSHSSGAAGTLMLGVRNDAGGTTFTDTNGDYSPIAVDNLGRVIISILSLSPGTSAANLGKAEDAGHSSGDVGVMSLCVRAASATDRSAGATDGDYEPCAVDANGKLWTNADTYARYRTRFIRHRQHHYQSFAHRHQHYFLIQKKNSTTKIWRPLRILRL